MSFRDVEDLLAERGIEISYVTARRWVLKFGGAFACSVRRCRACPHEQWHLDEMIVTIKGKKQYFWRAVDAEGDVLEFLVQSKPNAKAARHLMGKLLKYQGFAPSTVVTDKLRSYGKSFRDLGLSCSHVQGMRKNNLAENSRQPIRRRERKMQRFKSPGLAQRFLSLHRAIYNLFNLHRHLISLRTLRQFRNEAFDQWNQTTAAA